MHKKLVLASAIALTTAAGTVSAAAPTAEEMWAIIQQQQQQIADLKKQLETSDSQIKETRVQVAATADAIESINTSGTAGSSWVDKTTLGGYGEHHFNHFRDSDDQVDAHRFVLFLGHQFTDNVKLFSELEIEHGLVKDTADGSGPGEVELEQAYIQWDYTRNHAVLGGQFLLPVGILNETHEPDTFYGVERNKIESNIIPTTWWETGVMFQGEILPGLSYNAAVHSGLKTDDGGKVRGGRQKSAKATAEDPAYTVRLKYTGVPGLELAATAQYQTEITQGNALDSASGTLLEAHAIYQQGPFGVRALWAGWDIDGDGFEANGRDEQEGWFVEPSYKLFDNLGFFVRYSEYNNEAGITTSDDLETWDYGLNYWLHPNVVIKADYSNNKDLAGKDNDSLNLGLGWSF